MLPIPPGDVVLRDGRRLRRADEAEEAMIMCRIRRRGDCTYEYVRVWNGPNRLLVFATHTWFEDLGGRRLHISASYGSSMDEELRRPPSDKDMIAPADAFFSGSRAIIMLNPVNRPAVRQLPAEH
jgi:hypothetical protein